MTDANQTNPVENQLFSDREYSGNNEVINTLLESPNYRFNDIFSVSTRFPNQQVNERYSQLEQEYTDTEI
ncbi:hypothetical protein I8748_00560 [Nostoc sp. CENA67]|uniref:Uncharacterized protein n=1 Tax=Amazonocrinis nigriterrae CENA67 TaxID=2794033 RepID=A0A8J7HJR9_9NOST|nr:hypothetical protein [Amazonocrinis nigriterrae]MBH8560713.1 hypothetical protein [Amazonocrinis nigriterrae CENA67]